MGLVRVLPLPWVRAPRLLQHPLGEGPPLWTLCLLLHQGGEGKIGRKYVCFCARVADEPKQENKCSVKSYLHRDMMLCKTPDGLCTSIKQVRKTQISDSVWTESERRKFKSKS